MHYTFQQSKIWNGSDPDAIDLGTRQVTVKVQKHQGEEEARRRLPFAGLGRHWVLIKTRARSVNHGE